MACPTEQVYTLEELHAAPSHSALAVGLKFGS